MPRAGSVHVGIAEAGASVADLGTLLPITAALVLGNGIDATAALGVAGALFIVAGVFYRVPMPVQPIKAAAAIAIATHAPVRVVAAAGLVLGVILVVLGITGAVVWLARIFPKPIIRGNQLGVGILLVIAAVGIVRRAPGDDLRALVVAGVLVAILGALGERARRLPVALLAVAGGTVWSVAHGASASLASTIALPSFVAPGWSAMATALTLLVIPQLPLTLGNAVIGTADIEREYFGNSAHRVTPRALCLTSGLANVVTGALGGMPLCHGSSGATAYKRFGARTGGVNLVIGSVLVIAGLAFGRAALDVFALIPAPVLGALLATTGLRHAMLVRDQRGWQLWVALAMGVIGGLTRNLTIGMAVGLPAFVILAGGARMSRRASNPGG